MGNLSPLIGEGVLELSRREPLDGGLELLAWQRVDSGSRRENLRRRETQIQSGIRLHVMVNFTQITSMNHCRLSGVHRLP